MKYVSLTMMALMLGSMIFLVSCNTVEGFGKDIQSVGKAIEDVVE